MGRCSACARKKSVASGRARLPLEPVDPGQGLQVGRLGHRCGRKPQCSRPTSSLSSNQTVTFNLGKCGDRAHQTVNGMLAGTGPSWRPAAAGQDLLSCRRAELAAAAPLTFTVPPARTPTTTRDPNDSWRAGSMHAITTEALAVVSRIA